jgi:hypothetical protein
VRQRWSEGGYSLLLTVTTNLAPRGSGVDRNRVCGLQDRPVTRESRSKGRVSAPVRAAAHRAGRIAPPWASLPDRVGGAPRLYVFLSCKHLIAQLKSAPVAADGVDAGEAVDPKWATNHGHAVDAARYGALSRPPPSEEPSPPPFAG